MPIKAGNTVKFFKAETLFSTFTPDMLTGKGIFKFGGDTSQKFPFCVRTGGQSLGAPTDRKSFRAVDVYAEGTVNGLVGIRIYIDGRYVCSGGATCSDQPNVHRRINIPVAKSEGYSIDIELAGNVRLRAVSTKFEGVN